MTRDHHLVGCDLVVGQAEREAAWWAAFSYLAEQLLTAPWFGRIPTAKAPRKPSLAARLKAVRRAGAEAEIKPDGTIFTREKRGAGGEQSNGAQPNPWDVLP